MLQSCKGLMLGLIIIILGATGCALLKSAEHGAVAGTDLGCLAGNIATIGSGVGCVPGAAIGFTVGGTTGAIIGMKNALVGETDTALKPQPADSLPPEYWKDLPQLTRDQIAQHLKAKFADNPSYEPSREEIDHVILIQWQQQVLDPR